MAEQQNIEYKESWRDEYLKWVCGFANAQGGTIYIGVHDQGHVVGVSEPKKLLEDIPSKISSHLGIVCDVNLKEDQSLPYIEIYTPPYQVPISYHGEYHYRSGATRQVLRGVALQQFLLRKLGKTWDDVVEPKGSWNDLDPSLMQVFVQNAQKSDRMRFSESEATDAHAIVDNLQLLEEGHLKRGALLLFGKKPTQFVPGAYLKIGRFGRSDSDLLFQEIVEGNILQMADKTIDLLISKFLPAEISYEGIQRIEKLPYPRVALREVILNAIAHRDYFGGPIQISVYEDKLIIWNEGDLPSGVTVEDLKRKHPSRPRNPRIADVFFKAGLIESWGRGTIRIMEECVAAGLPEPAFELVSGGFQVTIFKDLYNENYIAALPINDRQKEALQWVKNHKVMKNADYVSLLSVNDRTALRDLDDLVKKGYLLREGDKKNTTYRLNLNPKLS
jgi:ATP-dependent DNA helicase RecG